MRCQQFFIGLLMTAAGIALPAFAQWPPSADTNLLICNHTGEQTLPKIAAAPDGGCYISWYDYASGNYDVYMQRLDPDGVEQFADNGLLISSHPQDSWLTDYDLAVDAAGYAIVTFNDIRAGGDWDIYAYRISPAGEFVWGPNGLTISDNADFEADPRVCVTSGGNIVFSWQQAGTTNIINVRKVTPAGVDVWSPPIINFTTTYGVSIPRLAPAGNDAFVLQYLVHQGSQIWSPRFIYAQKFDSIGTLLWGTDGVVVSNAGGLGPQMRPDIVSDGTDGVYSYWYDSHDANQLYVYAQHVLNDGTPQWAANGVRASLAAGEIQMSPTLAKVAGTDQIIIFYLTANQAQSLWGIGGQALNAAGLRQWTDNGITFVPLGSQQQLLLSAQPQAGGAALVYLEYVPDSGVNSCVKGFRTDGSGAYVWPDSPRILCSVVSEKGRLAATVNHLGQVIAAWPDHRNDSGDIYLQNINTDGSLGPLSSQPPLPFSLILPADNDTSGAELVTFVWHLSSDPDGGDVTYDLVLQMTEPDHIVRVAGLSDTTHNLTWFEITGEPEHDWITVEWWVEAVSGDDTTHSTETWHFVIPEVTVAGDQSGIAQTFALNPAYPNPFNPVTTISFELATPSFATLKIFNIDGQEVATLINTQLDAGQMAVNFDAANLPSGLYIARITAGTFTASAKLLLLK